MRRARVGAALVVLLASGACSGGSAGSETVEVTIRYSRFIPDHFDFAAGTTVEFVVTNSDPIDHEFIIGDEDVQQVHEEGTEAHHGARPGEISIAGGETRSTTYSFEEPGNLMIGCHLPTHYDYGMRGTIAVTD